MRMYPKTILCFILILSLIGVECGCSHRPPDKELVDLFYSNKNNFEQLLNMLSIDKSISTIRGNSGSIEHFGESSISDSRLAEYKVILKRLSAVKSVSRSKELDKIEFLVYSEGFSVTHGYGKGIVYLAEKPPSIKDNLEDVEKTVGQNAVNYKYIDGNWYLFVEMD